MKQILVFIFCSLLSIPCFSTGQKPDYLIIEQDTFPIFNNPLVQYFEHTESQELIGFHSACWSTACWRGYVAYWEMANDSLFLVKITGCIQDCWGNTDADLEAMFGTNRPFAHWYTGTLKIPLGECYRGSSMGYNSLWEYEKELSIVKGVFAQQQTFSNVAFIEHLKNQDSLNTKIVALKDTFLFYFSKTIDLENPEETFFDCNQTYILNYDEKGELIDVEVYQTYQPDYTPLIDKLAYRLNDDVCARRIKRTLQPFSLAYLNPPNPFQVELEIWQLTTFRIIKLELWTVRLSLSELEEYVRHEMDISE